MSQSKIDNFLLDKPNTIIEDNQINNDYLYNMNFNKCNVYFFHKKTKTPKYRFEWNNGLWFELTLIGNFHRIINKLNNEISLNDNLTYKLLFDVIKEEIIINNIPPRNYFDFTISHPVNTIISNLRKNGIFTVDGEVYDENNEFLGQTERLLSFKLPFVVDSENNKYSLTATIIDSNIADNIKTITLRYSIDYEILNNLVYPITFDPDIVVQTANIYLDSANYYSNDSKWLRSKTGRLFFLAARRDDLDLYVYYSDDDFKSTTNAVKVYNASSSPYHYNGITQQSDGTLYVATATAGSTGRSTYRIYKSTDDGLNWSYITNVSTTTMYNPKLYAGNDDTLYLMGAGAYNGCLMHYSTNNGVSWTTNSNWQFRRQSHHMVWWPGSDIVWLASSDDGSAQNGYFQTYNTATNSWGTLYWVDVNPWTAVTGRLYITSLIRDENYLYISYTTQKSSDSLYSAFVIKWNITSHTITNTYTYSDYYIVQLGRDELTGDILMAGFDLNGNISGVDAVYYSKNFSGSWTLLFQSGEAADVINFNYLTVPKMYQFHYHHLINAITYALQDNSASQYYYYIDNTTTYKPTQII